VRERIAVRGKKFDPSDFERALLDVPGLRKGCFSAFGVDDAKTGTQRVVIVCEAHEPLERPRSELVAAVRERIYRQLDLTVGDVVLVKSGTLSKTSSGKRRHRNFAQMYREGKLGAWLVEGAA
jgi:acyl-CoA synthetase (AMP-forming)/AMP-acid ligase II